MAPQKVRDIHGLDYVAGKEKGSAGEDCFAGPHVRGDSEGRGGPRGSCAGQKLTTILGSRGLV